MNTRKGPRRSRGNKTHGSPTSSDASPGDVADTEKEGGSKADSAPKVRTLRDSAWVMARLGLKSRGTLGSMIFRRQLPFVRLGPRHVRFDEEAIERWLAEVTVPPKSAAK